MKDNIQPLLTIGIIFKNDIRCIKRCLEALKPIRESVSCELIMADTGSLDGSREIAAQYADILFDFPWIGDFSAARNAVMERASGKWYLTIDTDEYLDGNVSEVAEFLQGSGKETELVCGVVQRNYGTLDMDSRYSDFMAVRMICMSTKLRYEGIIHETWPIEKHGIHDIRVLSHTILHHDGYVGLDGAQGKEKRERNLELLRKCLKQDPDDLKVLLQYVESGIQESDFLEILKRAVKKVEEKHSGWNYYGPSLLRHAIKAALEKDLLEYEKWDSLAEKMFPDSPFVRIDIEYMGFTYNLKAGNTSETVRRGEKYLRAVAKFHEDEDSLATLAFGTLMLASPYWEQSLKIFLSDVYIKNGSVNHAKELLQSLNATLLDEQQTKNLLCVLGDLHRLSLLDTSLIIQDFFRGIKEHFPSKEISRKREEVFYKTALLAFLSETRITERQQISFCRPSYMLFLPLINECDIGRGAAVLALQNPDEIQLVLSKVEDWEQFPIEALSHALELGIPFPLTEKKLKTEEMERLAARLSESTEDYVSWLMDIIGNIFDGGKQHGSLQTLAWTQYLIVAAVRSFGWKTDKTGKGVELAKLFSVSEKEYLAHFYAPELLCPENLALLPALHRFGWHCAKAFDALDTGDSSAYVRELKAGLEVCPEANAIAEYLIKYTPQLKACRQDVSEELLNLAEQVRKMLSSYPPNHPAVAAIKASDAYKTVAELIEIKRNEV